MDLFNRFKVEDSYTINVSDFRDIVQNKIMKPPRSAYFLWLNQNRMSIKEEFFSDFNDITEWDSETFNKYYELKGLDKPNKPSKNGKPRIVGLVAKKAGIIWKNLSDEEKEPYLKQFNEIKHKSKSQVKKKECIESSDEENISVEEYEYQGKTYYIESDTKDVYDPSTEQKVGKFINNEIEFN